MSNPTIIHSSHLFSPTTEPQSARLETADEFVIDLDADRPTSPIHDDADRARARKAQTLEPAKTTETAPLRAQPPRRVRSASRQRSQPGKRGRAPELRLHSRSRRYERLEAVLAWAEANRRSVPTDALLMIVECEADFETWPPDCWTEHGLWQFLWSEVNTACVLAGRPEPRGMAESMWLYLEYLEQTVGLAAGSDPLPMLQEFLQEYGDLTDSGSPRTPDDSRPPAAQFQPDLESAA